jgi:EthD domain
VIRLVHLLRRAPGLSQTEFSTLLRDRHGPLLASVQTDLDIVRYVQTHPDPAGQGLGQAAADARGGMQPAFDAVAEYWWQSEASLERALASPAGKAAAQMLVEGERGLADLAASPMWFAIEYPQVSSGLVRTVARMRSTVMRIHFALQPLASLTDDQARLYWLGTHGPLVRSHSVARGLIAYNQVHRLDCPLLSAFTGPRGTTADPCLGHAEAWFERPSGLAPPAETLAAMTAAIEDEARFIDWDRSTILVGKELTFVDREWAM